MKEMQIQRQILDYLKEVDGYFFRTNNIGVPLHGGGGYRPSPVKGLADILGVFKGWFIAIEVKSAKGKVSADQAKFLTQIRNNGGHAIVARSVDTVIEYLTHLEKVKLKEDDEQMRF